MSMKPIFQVFGVVPTGKCAMSGKETEVIEVASADGVRVNLCIAEFTKLLRLELHKAAIADAATPRRSDATKTDAAA